MNKASYGYRSNLISGAAVALRYILYMNLSETAAFNFYFFDLFFDMLFDCLMCFLFFDIFLPYRVFLLFFDN